MSEPIRIQLSRRKGWRKPDNTVVVSRPSRWGNPFRAKDWRPNGEGFIRDNAEAVELFRAWLVENPLGRLLAFQARHELRGKNLACWCSAGPCHADVLLAISNEPEAVAP